MPTTQLSGIAEELSKAKGESASTIKSLLETKTLAEPLEDQIKAHFLSKYYFYSASIDDAGDLSLHEQEEMFFELVDRALFATFTGKNAAAKKHFETATTIAEKLNDEFLKMQLKTVKAVANDKAKLKKKLICDSSYEQINKMFAKDEDEAKKTIALTRYFALEIGDKRRELDALTKVLYLMASSDDETAFPAAIMLSRYIQEQEPEYETSTIWALFHEGNIYITLGNKQRLADQPDLDKAKEYFGKAKDCFEEALEISIKKVFDYATMTMQERLGLVNNRLGRFNIASSNFNESLSIGEFGEIKKDWLVVKNKVRCLIGLGNVHLDSGLSNSSDKEIQLDEAENYFKQALELAQQINYSGNTKVALDSLKEVCEARGEQEEIKCLEHL